MRGNSKTISLSGRRKKKLQKQIDKYLSDLKNDQENYKLHVDLADAYALLEQFERGISHYYKAIDLLRQSPKFGRVRNLIIELYNKLIKIAPDDARAYMDLSEEYITAGQKEKAFRFLLSSARKAQEAENYELALQCYQQVIAKGKTNPHIVERCTELYLKLNMEEEARQNYIHIGDIYAQEEKYIEALEYYKKAGKLKQGERDPELLLKIARMYNSMEWNENAASELVKLAEFYEQRKNYTEALKYYRNSVRLDPENERAQQGKERVTDSFTIDVAPEELEEESQDIVRTREQLENPRDQPPQADREILSLENQSAPDEPVLDLRGDDHSSDDQAARSPLASDLGLDQSLDIYLETGQYVAPSADKEGDRTEIQFISVDSLEAFESEDKADLVFELDEPGAEPEEEAGEKPVLPVEETGDTDRRVLEFTPETDESAATPAAAEEAARASAQMEEEPATPPAVDEQPAPAEAAPQAEAPAELHQHIETLQQQVQQIEAEKEDLQAQFSEQISQLKSQEHTLQQDVEAVNAEKAELENRLQQLTTTSQAARRSSEKFDEARYEALVAKIQNKKAELQQHLDKLLQKREANGHLLTAELENLSATKDRLQDNLHYIQHVKGRIETKINTELQQAKQQVKTLTANAEQLQTDLEEKQRLEAELREQADTLRREKDELHENYTQTIDALTQENSQLEHRMHELTQSEQQTRQALEKKVNSLRHSYQLLKNEYKAALEAKEQQIADNAQQLSEFADKYVALEKTLEEIRQERDRLGTMLSQETATRETLEDQLIGVESQVDSLETQGTKLLTELGKELDRQLAAEQSVSDKFQLSLDELEGLLVLQEKEIRSLEAL